MHKNEKNEKKTKTKEEASNKNNLLLLFVYTVPGGWAQMARKVEGSPPLDTVPPLPWKSESATPALAAVATSRSWDLYCAHAAASLPASLALSE